jgi:alpha/beta superfamily hydrolase
MPLEITGPIGPLEALLDEPAPGRTVSSDGLVHTAPDNGLRAAVVLAHPHTAYGGTMHTKVIYQAAKALTRIGCAVLRINFRGAGRSSGAFDDGPGEMDDFRAALDFVHHRYPAARFWAGGMSFGAWTRGSRPCWASARRSQVAGLTQCGRAKSPSSSSKVNATSSVR